MNVPLSAINRALTRFVSQVKEIPKDELTTWQNILLKEFGQRGQLVKQRFPVLKDILPEFPRLQRMPKEEEEALFFNTFADFFALSTPGGKEHLFFLDDLQWADATSIKLLKFIAQRSRTIGLGKALFLGAFRSEEVTQQHPFAEHVLCEVKDEQYIQLDPLNKNETYTLVEELLDEKSLEINELKKYVQRLTEGIPFFVYETLKAALSDKVFHINKLDVWTFDYEKAQKSDIHNEVDKLVISRIEKLTESSILVIQIAAVLGFSVKKEYLIETISRLSDLDVNFHNETQEKKLTPDEILILANDELKRKHLIIDNPNEFKFFHDRIREAALKLTDQNLKKMVHTEFGNILGSDLLRNKINDSKDIFEAAYHVMSGNQSKYAALTKELLIEATKHGFQIFSYKRARDYIATVVSLLPEDPTSIKNNAKKMDEWVTTNELLADAKALSEEVRESIKIYEYILQYIDDPLRRANIYKKISSNNLYLFQYPESIAAGMACLKEIDEPYISSEIYGFFYIIFNTPILIIRVLFYILFGKQNKVVQSKKEEMKWDVRMALEFPFYFLKPIAAIANHYKNTIGLLPYTDSTCRNLVFAYWGIVFSGIGMPKSAEIMYNKSLRYFEVNHNPVLTVFATFVKGYVLKFGMGKIDQAQELLEGSVHLAEEVGEAFFRFIGYQALIQLDFYGKGTGAAPIATSKLIAFCEKIKYLPTINGSILRQFIMIEDYKMYDKWRDLICGQGEKSAKEGYTSIDVVYSYLAPGEALILQDKPKEAIVPLRKAVWNSTIHLHRVGSCLLAPVYLTQAYIRSNKRIGALIALAFSWLNILLGLKIFHPQTIAATGEVIVKFGFKSIGIGYVRKALRKSMRSGWSPVASELRVLLAGMIMNERPEEAETHLLLAEKFFRQRKHIFLQKKAKKMINKVREILAERYPKVSFIGYKIEENIKFGETVINQKFMNDTALLGIYRQLSVMTNVKELTQTILDIFCACTGATQAVAFLNEENVFIPKGHVGMDFDKIITGDYLGAGFDIDFFETVANNTDVDIRVRKNHFHSILGVELRGSVMVVPLRLHSNTPCIVYLGNHSTDDLFDDLNLNYIKLISGQAAISLNNFALIKSQEEKIKASSKLEAVNKYKSMLEDVYSQINKLANSDSLTGLSNRRDIMKKLNDSINKIDGTDSKISLILCDIDFFKKFNDAHGHECGDFVLTELSKILKSAVCEKDHIARWGGEEFLLVLPEKGEDEACKVAENIKAQLEDKKFMFKDKNLEVNLTFGVTEYSPEISIDASISNADKALYEGKENGRNQVVRYCKHKIAA
jgi:diguanylate cyclase (GGDEF)-like protein